MRLFLALAASLLLHLGLLAASALRPATPLPPRLDVRLESREAPREPPDEPVQALNTERDDRTATPPPQLARGGLLRRAQGALTRHLFYPPEAVARGWQGEVILLLDLDRDGRVVNVSVATGSGHALLDQAALEAARGIGRLPGGARQMLLPVNFRLE